MSRPVALIVRAVVLAVCLASPLARAVDYTDIWFNPAESGWGVNVVQSDNFLFLTFFIYGADNKPTWYTGQLTWDGTKYTGGLYATQGTNWAVPWIAGNVTTQPVGTATFQPNDLNAYQATLSYIVTGVGTATKSIERQTLTTIALSGAYVGGQSGSYSSCAMSSQNGAYIDSHLLTVVHNTNGTATFTFVYDSGATCIMSGTLEQHGQLYRIPGASYQCTGSLTFNTTATMYEIKQTALGVEGRFAATLPSGCAENANFSGVLR
jgi:hypothetical protein